jgi:hypothetical protein
VMCLPIGGAQIYACASAPINERGLCDNNQGTCESGTCTTREKTLGLRAFVWVLLGEVRSS